MLTGPPLLIVGPLIPALITLVLRRWRVAMSFIGAASLILLSVGIARIELDQSAGVALSANSLVIVGRSLVLTEQIQVLAIFIYRALALLFILEWLLPQSSLYKPLCLALLTPMFVALMIAPAIFGAAILAVASGAISLLLQGDRAGSTLASLRYFTLVIVAVMLLLLASWMLGTNQGTYLPTASRFFLVALAILLAVFPFHIWIGPLVKESGSLVSPIVAGLVNLVFVIFAMNLLSASPAVRSSLLFTQFLRVSGLITVLIAVLQAISAHTFGRLLGFLLLFNMGVTAIAFSYADLEGLQATLSVIILRVVSITLAGVGLGLIRYQLRGIKGGDDEFIRAGHALSLRTPLGVGLYLYGGLSLAGLPFTPGFSGHWAVISLVAEQNPWQAALIIMAGFTIVLVLTRSLSQIISSTEQPISFELIEGRYRRIGAVLLLATGFFISIFPQMILKITSTLSQLI